MASYTTPKTLLVQFAVTSDVYHVPTTPVTISLRGYDLYSMSTYAAELHNLFFGFSHRDWDWTEPNFSIYLPPDTDLTQFQDGAFFFTPDCGVTRSKIRYTPSLDPGDWDDEVAQSTVTIRDFPIQLFPPGTGKELNEKFLQGRIMTAYWHIDVGSTVSSPTGELDKAAFRALHRFLDTIKQDQRNLFRRVVMLTCLHRAIPVPVVTDTYQSRDVLFR